MRYIRGILLSILILCVQCVFSWTVTTTDFSYLLPHNGQMIRTSSDVTVWAIQDGFFRGDSSAYFDDVGQYLVLKCFATDSGFIYSPPMVGVGPNLQNIPLDMSTSKRMDFLVQVTFRGGTYCGGTIFGQFQPSVNSAYLGPYGLRAPMVSPGYLEAVTLKCVEDRGFNVYKYDTDTAYPGGINRYSYERVFNYGTFAVSTEWITFNWRFCPTQENYCKLGYLGLTYVPNPPPFDYFNNEYYINDTTRCNSIPLPFTTEVQVKEVKLYGLSYDYGH